MRKILLTLSILFLSLGIFIGHYIYNNLNSLNGSGFYILLSCLLSLSAVCLGWWISLHISKRQSTLNILAQSRMSEYYLGQIKNFENIFPAGEKLTVEKAEANKKALSSLLIILNFLEFISIGMKHGDLSESVCKAFFSGIFTRQWFRCSEYIDHRQVHEHKDLFINFEYYAKKWNASLNK